MTFSLLEILMSVLLICTRGGWGRSLRGDSSSKYLWICWSSLSQHAWFLPHFLFVACARDVQASGARALIFCMRAASRVNLSRAFLGAVS